MITGTTSTGYEFSIDERVLNDWEFLKIFATSKNPKASNEEKVIAGYELVNMLLGKEEMEKLLDKIRKDNDGFAPQEKVYEVVNEIVTIAGEKKQEVKN